MTDGRSWFLLAGALSLLAALLHVACIIGGPSWYRMLGAGDELANAAARGAKFPAVITAAISAVLLVWSAYAFSAAGIGPVLPLRRTALVLITLVLCLRGFAIAVPGMWRPDLSLAFKLWSSVAVLILAGCFAIGTVQSWPTLSPKDFV